MQTDQEHTDRDCFIFLLRNTEKSEQKKRKVIHKHNLAMHMEHAARSHKQHTSEPGWSRIQMLGSEPYVTEKHRCDIQKQHIADDDIQHRHHWEKTAKDNIRSEKPIISKLEAVRSSAEPNP